MDMTLFDEHFNVVHRVKKRKLTKAIPETNEVLSNKFDLEFKLLDEERE